MSIRVSKHSDNMTAIFSMPEKFDFSVHKDFRSSYENSGMRQFIIDMNQTNYMDSAALGMLLQLREYTGNNAKGITIKNTNDGIREILYIANFNSLMNIE